MNPEEHSPPQTPAFQLLSPAAWLLIAVVLVAAFAGLAWLSVRDRVEAGGAGGAGGAGAMVFEDDQAGAARPEQVLALHRARVQEWLMSYGWIDREAGIARVPIQEGMRMVLSEGLPAREEIEDER